MNIQKSKVYKNINPQIKAIKGIPSRKRSKCFIMAEYLQFEWNGLSTTFDLANQDDSLPLAYSIIILNNTLNVICKLAPSDGIEPSYAESKAAALPLG